MRITPSTDWGCFQFGVWSRCGRVDGPFCFAIPAYPEVIGHRLAAGMALPPWAFFTIASMHGSMDCVLCRPNHYVGNSAGKPDRLAVQSSTAQRQRKKDALDQLFASARVFEQRAFAGFIHASILTRREDRGKAIPRGVGQRWVTYSGGASVEPMCEGRKGHP